MTHEHDIRVRYGETDQMGVVYYGNYALYAEVFRTELLRSCGTDYRALEARGIELPVADLAVRYRRPARYDDVLTGQTTIEGAPGRTITFRTRVMRGHTEVAEIRVVLACVDRSSGRVTRLPRDLVDRLAPFVEA